MKIVLAFRDEIVVGAFLVDDGTIIRAALANEGSQDASVTVADVTRQGIDEKDFEEVLEIARRQVSLTEVEDLSALETVRIV